MNIYLIDDDMSVCNILKIIIEQKKIGIICGTSNNGEDALEDLKFVSPDIVIVDLLMPIMDGITFVKKAKEKYPEICFVMLSQVNSKDMVSQAYECGISFFIQKPVNAIEVVKILNTVIDNINLKRTFNQMQSLLFNEQKSTAMPNDLEQRIYAINSSDQPDEKYYIKKLKNILQKIGIIGESGSNDIITLVNFIITNSEDCSKITVRGLCDKCCDDNSKSMEQRIRRTAATGLTNLAHMGIEDYSNDTFNEYAGIIYNFEQVRKEMDFVRGKSIVHGKVSLRSFLNSLAFYCNN